MNGRSAANDYLFEKFSQNGTFDFCCFTFCEPSDRYHSVLLFGFPQPWNLVNFIGNLSARFVWNYATLRDQELGLILLLRFYFCCFSYGKIEMWFILFPASFVDCRAFVGWVCVLLCIVRASLFHWTPSFDFTLASLTAPVYYSVNQTAGIYGIGRLRPIGKSTSNHY